jgi:hypothetical protein
VTETPEKLTNQHFQNFDQNRSNMVESPENPLNVLKNHSSIFNPKNDRNSPLRKSQFNAHLMDYLNRQTTGRNTTTPKKSKSKSSSNGSKAVGAYLNFSGKRLMSSNYKNKIQEMSPSMNSQDGQSISFDDQSQPSRPSGSKIFDRRRDSIHNARKIVPGSEFHKNLQLSSSVKKHRELENTLNRSRNSTQNLITSVLIPPPSDNSSHRIYRTDISSKIESGQKSQKMHQPAIQNELTIQNTILSQYSSN